MSESNLTNSPRCFELIRENDQVIGFSHRKLVRYPHKANVKIPCRHVYEPHDARVIGQTLRFLVVLISIVLTCLLVRLITSA